MGACSSLANVYFFMRTSVLPAFKCTMCILGAYDSDKMALDLVVQHCVCAGN